MTAREQKRKNEKIEKDAKSYLRAIMVRFLKWTEGIEDLGTKEVSIKVDEYEITWKCYCRRNNLTEITFGIFREHANQALLKMQELDAQKLLGGDSLPEKNNAISN